MTLNPLRPIQWILAGAATLVLVVAAAWITHWIDGRALAQKDAELATLQAGYANARADATAIALAAAADARQMEAEHRARNEEIEHEFEVMRAAARRERDSLALRLQRALEARPVACGGDGTAAAGQPAAAGPNSSEDGAGGDLAARIAAATAEVVTSCRIVIAEHEALQEQVKRQLP
jgi:hypothetical protein